ncbi:amino acid permease [Labrys sp. KNU-23]|uniref:amino acid permease n=1 Tax=Labrys sp. KNU-23 TaxID=2789216 RepID=UPI0011EDE94B|nr:amino acid permease [Labrys sp. KNU-23]QEN87643.1 amino acid permease [Labrys sp. KNU-23]
MTIETTSRPTGGVTYQSVDQAYFEQRQLKRHAGLFTLWMMGVGAVVAGEYSGWNIGLSQGGFGGMLLGALIIGFMYVCLCSSISEMSAALPHTGGAYSFARTALGPWGGFTTGLAENIEFVLAPGANMFFMASYLAAIFGTPDSWLPLWWVAGYMVMLGLSVRGLELSMRVVVWITVAAVLVLLFFFAVAIPYVDFARHALNIGAEGKLVADGNGPWLPFGLTGIMLSLPFGVYMFLAVEQLPLTAEEAKNPTRDMPRALILSILTLIALALGVLFFSASIPPGAHAMGSSGEPLLDGFRTIFGDGWAKLLAGVAVLGLAASFFAGSFASGRNIYSLSRAGYLPTVLSVTNPRTKTPNIALATGAGFALIVLLAIWFLGGKDNVAFMAGFLVSMIVFAGMVSYILQSIAFLRLRRLYPDIARPFRSPFGAFGAYATIGICILTLGYQFFDPLYRWAAIAAAAWYLIGLGYFGFYRRHRLVLSPEEEFAVSGGTRGRPLGEH